MCLYIAVVCMGRMWYRYGLCEAHAQVSFKRQVSTLLLIVSFLLLLPSFTPICRGRLRTDRSPWICLTQYMYITLHHFHAHITHITEEERKFWTATFSCYLLCVTLLVVGGRAEDFGSSMSWQVNACPDCNTLSTSLKSTGAICHTL